VLARRGYGKKVPIRAQPHPNNTSMNKYQAVVLLGNGSLGPTMRLMAKRLSPSFVPSAGKLSWQKKKLYTKMRG
jgi:hypothetical protein